MTLKDIHESFLWIFSELKYLEEYGGSIAEGAKTLPKTQNYNIPLGVEIHNYLLKHYGDLYLKCSSDICKEVHNDPDTINLLFCQLHLLCHHIFKEDPIKNSEVYFDILGLSFIRILLQPEHISPFIGLSLGKDIALENAEILSAAFTSSETSFEDLKKLQKVVYVQIH